MSQVSPPKPWERGGAAASAGVSSLTPATSPPQLSQQMSAPSSTPAPTATSTTAATSSNAPPSLPQRPSTLTNAAAVGPYSTLNRPGYGGMTSTLGSTYGTYGGMGGYSSPYSRFGGGMYGGMGGMGGYGMGGYGMGGMGGYGAGMDPNDPNSLMNGMQSSTQATFQMIESIVQAFGGFAQMLESTYMATHSSFFAMVRVAEQFGNLKNTLGSILGIFTVLRWARTLIAKATGRPMPASAGDLTPANFAQFEGRPDFHGTAKPSKKPFIFFVLAVFGLPYLMGKLIRSLAAKQEEQVRAQMGEQIDPSKLEFCRVMYDFAPEQSGVELEVKKGDLVAVLSKSDPMGQPSQWWKCRARDSRVGYLPSPYLESIVRKDQKQITDGPAAAAAGSRTNTMTSQSAKIAAQAVSGKSGDISLESFQKSQFNS